MIAVVSHCMLINRSQKFCVIYVKYRFLFKQCFSLNSNGLLQCRLRYLKPVFCLGLSFYNQFGIQVVWGLVRQGVLAGYVPHERKKQGQSTVGLLEKKVHPLAGTRPANFVYLGILQPDGYHQSKGSKNSSCCLQLIIR